MAGPRLSELLQNDGQSQVQMTYPAPVKEIATLGRPSCLFVDRKDVGSWVKGFDAPHKDDEQLIGNLEVAWRDADAAVIAVATQRPQGISVGEGYTPLAAPLLRAIGLSFKGHIGFLCGPSELVLDPALGGIRREMDKRLPTVHDTMRPRRMLVAHIKPPARQLFDERKHYSGVLELFAVFVFFWVFGSRLRDGDLFMYVDN